MKAVVSRLVLALTFGITACGDRSLDAHGDRGTIELAVREVPEEARCLRVAFSGSTGTRTKPFDLTPGTSLEFEETLPVGLVTIDARAFPLACSSVQSGSAPTYVLEAPVTARVRADSITRVALALQKSARVSLEVDFQNDGLGGASGPIELAVIGDTPYGNTQLERFPSLIEHIEGEAGLSALVHVGDIKNGSTRCDTSYFERIAHEFSRSSLPVIYTPGDNEWTDCHRANNGAYDPLERLATLRSLFFPEPGFTLGARRAVLSQATLAEHAAFVENRLWTAASTVFATVHVTGSANGLAPWFGTGGGADDPDRRIAEVEARIAAALDWIGRTFDLAEDEEALGVVVFMQADTFSGTTNGFEAVIRLLAERATAFARPVLLVQGDSHRYLVDQPLANGSAAYGIEAPVPNLTRVVVEGETAEEWLKLRVDPASPEVFAWERRSLPDAAGVPAPEVP